MNLRNWFHLLGATQAVTHSKSKKPRSTSVNHLFAILAILAYQSAATAGHAVAYTFAGTIPTVETGERIASSTSTYDQFGTQVAQAQAYVAGLPAPTLPATYIPLSLGVAASTAPVGTPIDARATWSDTLTNASSVRIDGMILRFHLSGLLEASIGADPGPGFPAQSSASVRLSVYDNNRPESAFRATWSLNSQTGSSYQTVLISDRVTANPVNVDFRIPTNGGTYVDFTLVGPGPWGLQITLEAGALSYSGAAESLFFNTAALTGIFLPDGSTPESIGATLVFDSGIGSPNLASVPEPTSLALFGMGVFALVSASILRPARRLNRQAVRHGDASVVGPRVDAVKV